MAMLGHRGTVLYGQAVGIFLKDFSMDTNGFNFRCCQHIRDDQQNPSDRR